MVLNTDINNKFTAAVENRHTMLPRTLKPEDDQ